MNVISLFSGGMGLDIGLEQAGFNIVVSQDFNKDCVNTIKKNSKNPVVLGDIKELLNSDPSCNFLLEPSQTKQDDIFAIVGGPPCQPFSNAGKRLGIEDDRGDLFKYFSRIIETINPRFFIMENVRALKSDSMPGVYEHICDEFTRIGYSFIDSIVNAVDYGTPQFRERIIFIGSRDNEDLVMPQPTHFRIHQNKNYRWRTLRDAIQDLEANPGDCSNLSQNTMKYINFVPEGGNWKNIPDDIRKDAMGGAYESGGGKTGFFRRLSYSEPSPTLVTSPTQKMSLLCHPKFNRPLSVREYARIQGFPDTWQFKGSIAAQYKQIGNAVPIQLGNALGEMLSCIASNDYKVNTKKYDKRIKEPIAAKINDELGILFS